MADNKGSETDGLHEWCLLEADCSDIENDLETLLEKNSDSDISDLISNDGDLEQGNSRELFQQQELEESNALLQSLKRKYISPKAVLQLSPQLESISLSSDHKSRRKLFAEQDSGVELTLTNETEDVTTLVQQEEEVPSLETASTSNLRKADNAHYKELMRCSNLKATLLSKFKNAFGVSFAELTRQFRSNKTCCNDWVVAIYGVNYDLFESSKQLLQQHCDYIWVTELSAMYLYLLCFKAGKNRHTVIRLLISMLHVAEEQILSEPPKLRSTVSALFWYKGSSNSATFTHGSYPKWIIEQTLIGHQTGEAATFDMSTMVQWAFDNDLTDEADIAFQYAKLAPDDVNATAWLAHNNQARFVRECAAMVRYYKKGQMREMSMSAWIHFKLEQVEGEGQWSSIVKFIRYQGINFISFLSALKDFLHAKPKKNCLLIYGPPNTGKSAFTMSLIKVLHGRVISFVNSKSHFWLQPMSESKIALLDDATDPCWLYMDMYLRNGLDGHLVSLDCKHKAPMQIRFPPLLITSNINAMAEPNYKYLHSRLVAFEFPNPFPMKDDDTPEFELTDQSWKSFFKRLWTQLELSDQEDEGEDGEPEKAFRCSARSTNEHL
uniref:Replication protein E1 n=1 Tax=Human papillomavirus TaxID=10566 RepID=A0A385PI42_9PAPI|nr:MAG: E1 protein [Human papillomavirus]